LVYGYAVYHHRRRDFRLCRLFYVGAAFYAGPRDGIMLLFTEKKAADLWGFAAF
jgi:hypothetical protein